ncbi:hypothetical protein [Filifactor alocis]|nr:hypothetical protein [Filifactor alocis]
MTLRLLQSLRYDTEPKVPLSPMQEESFFSLLKEIRSVTSIMTSLSFCLE